MSAQLIDSFTEEERDRTTGPVEYVLNFRAPWMQPGFSGGPVISAGGGVVAVLMEQFAWSDSSDFTPMTEGRATAVYPVLELFKTPFQCGKKQRSKE